MPTLAVAGCSFSDYTRVKKVYGLYLSKIINYDYLHLARGGSSNDRSWFVSARAILNGQLKKDDILIVQYTDPFRKLLASQPPYAPVHGCDPGDPGRIETHSTPYGDAYTTDFKMHSHQWQPEKENKALHQAIEQAQICNEFDMENFAINHRLFESFCREHQVHFVPMITRYHKRPPPGNIVPPGECLDDISKRFSDKTRNLAFDETNFMRRGNAENPNPNDLGWNGSDEGKLYDSSHLSNHGHAVLADCLAKHLKGHKLLIS